MSSTLDQLIASARDYCGVIESLDQGGVDWLQRVSSLLPRLHAIMAAELPAGGVELGTCPKVDLDSRFELYTRMRRALGDRDSYWMEYDLGQAEEQKSGSLADDLTDIYCELKLGLSMLDEGVPTERVLSGWRRGFFLHWGKHLIDAERHLYELSAQNQLLMARRDMI